MIKSKHLLLLICIFCISGNIAMGQLGKITDRQLPYSRDLTFGALIHSGGLGMFGAFTKEISPKFWQYYSGQINTLKHPKEISVTNPTQQESGSYVFGKLNTITSIQFSYGIRYIIAEKSGRNSTKVNFNLGAGPTIALIKPIYYNVDYGSNDIGNQIEKFDIVENSLQLIVGLKPVMVFKRADK